MKVLVSIKRVVDASIPVRVKADGTGVQIEGLKMSINPFDEIAIEEAVRLREAGVAAEVVVVSVGSQVCVDILRTALALGADRAVLAEHDGAIEPLAVAKVLKAIAERERPDIILLGKQAIDDDANQVGQMLAALLKRPQGTFASKIDVGGDHIIVTREVDTGLETVKLELPAVVTTDLRLNQPRYASLPNIMKAKKKPLDVVAVRELGMDIEPRLRRISVRAPHARHSGREITDVVEFARLLRKEANLS